MPSGRLYTEMGEGCALQGRGWLREWGRAFLFLRAFGKRVAKRAQPRL